MARKADWPLRPFDPKCKKRTQRDEAVVDAVRQVLADWDGDNWSAVREVLLQTGRSRDDLAAMTPHDVRMAFAVGQRPIILQLGGRPQTATSSIVQSAFPYGPASGSAAPKPDHLAPVENDLPQVEIDEPNQIIRMGSKTCRFGGSELWGVFIRVWRARPAAVDLDEASCREGRAVAAELKDHLRRNGLDALAGALKNQRGMGYYFDLPDATE